MRSVAVALAVLTLVAAFPTVLSADECATPGSASFCVPIDASRPTSPPGVPSLPQTTYWGKYYLWLGAGHCTTLNLNDCRGYPPGTPVGVEKPDCPLAPSQCPAGVFGGTVGFGIFGLLYEETNGMAGLQRYYTSRAADRMVLV